jgi:hypothetical protein
MTHPHTIEEARAAKARAKVLLRNVAPGAPMGIGITKLDGGYGVKVNLQKALSSDIALPSEVDGVPLRFEITGPARSL